MDADDLGCKQRCIGKRISPSEQAFLVDHAAPCADRHRGGGDCIGGTAAVTGFPESLLGLDEAGVQSSAEERDVLASGVAYTTPSKYIPFDEPLTVNFPEGVGATYFQVGLTVFTQDQSLGAAMARHMAAIKTTFAAFLLVNSRTPSVLASRRNRYAMHFAKRLSACYCASERLQKSMSFTSPSSSFSDVRRTTYRRTASMIQLW